jgi:Asp-tRNA(Asn)/Glu-tRNA(Gln) amidotransferase A subunit family amidase
MTKPVNSLAATAKLLRSGDLHLNDYLDELEKQFQQREPVVKAFLAEEDRFARLRQEAKLLLERYPNPQERPLLFGIPVGVKDIFNVDGFETRAGSKLPALVFEGPEAGCVTRLKNAGALVLGKTVSAEFAYLAPGITVNPHHPEHTPGGSSSGSAAAVGAGICALTLGTQTVGSINRPAAFCGVVGFKPSYERVSRAGVLPVSASLDHVGFFTSDTESANLAASVMIPNWNSTTAERRPVLAVPDGPYMERVSTEGRQNFELSCERLAASGYNIVSLDVMHDFDEIFDRHQLIMAFEAAQVHSDWFGRYESLYREQSAALIHRGMTFSEQDWTSAQPGREKLRRELTATMAEAGVDLWIAPAATGTAPKGLESTGDAIMNLPWTHCGLPALNLPSGKDQTGLPFGLQLIGKWHEDEVLLAWATEIEKLTGFDGSQLY